MIVKLTSLQSSRATCKVKTESSGLQTKMVLVYIEAGNSSNQLRIERKRQ